MNLTCLLQRISYANNNFAQKNVRSEEILGQKLWAKKMVMPKIESWSILCQINFGPKTYRG